MTTRQKPLLIVDDDEGMRDTLGAILKRDYRVLTASSAEDALPVLRAEAVDLMLLDVRLPGMNGLELLRIVKDQYPLVEVIMISAVSEVETAVQAMKHGAITTSPRTSSTTACGRSCATRARSRTSTAASRC